MHRTDDVPEFFVPGVEDENLEQTYEELARLCRVAPPPRNQRVFSISYRHDGEEWTATVGTTLRGSRSRTVTRRGARVEQHDRLSDPALVLAIFPGYPYFVVTNHRIPRSVGSAWENPFMAGQPFSVTLFKAASDTGP